MYDTRFTKLLNYVFKNEGGYNNDPDDFGGPTNYGVTQTSYDEYRKRNSLPPKNVKYITKDEAKKLYWDDYYVKSGANKVQDAREAYVLLDTAINFHPVTAKRMYEKAGGNLYKMLEIRKREHQNQVEKYPSQAKFLQGWLNRINDINHNIDEIAADPFFAPSYKNNMTPFDADYKGSLKKFDYGDLNSSQIKHLKNKYRYLLNKNRQNGYPTGHAAPIEDVFYATEDIDKMSTEEFLNAEDIINNQIKNKVAVPKAEAQAGVKAGLYIYVDDYVRDDGTKVRGYYRHR